MPFCAACGKKYLDTANFYIACGISIQTQYPYKNDSNTIHSDSKLTQSSFGAKFIRREEKNAAITIMLGIALIIVSQTANFTKTRTYDTYDMNKRLGLPDPYNVHMLDQEITIDKEKKNLCLYGGLVLLAMGLYFNSRKQ